MWDKNVLTSLVSLAIELGHLPTWIFHLFGNGIDHVNILCSSLMEGDHTVTIIHVFLATDHGWIQLKYSIEIPHFPTFHPSKIQHGTLVGFEKVWKIQCTYLLFHSRFRHHNPFFVFSCSPFVSHLHFTCPPGLLLFDLSSLCSVLDLASCRTRWQWKSRIIIIIHGGCKKQIVEGTSIPASVHHQLFWPSRHFGFSFCNSLFRFSYFMNFFIYSLTMKFPLDAPNLSPSLFWFLMSFTLLLQWWCFFVVHQSRSWIQKLQHYQRSVVVYIGCQCTFPLTLAGFVDRLFWCLRCRCFPPPGCGWL